MNGGPKSKNTNHLNLSGLDFTYMLPKSQTQNLEVDFRIVPEQADRRIVPPNGANPCRIILTPIGKTAQSIGLELQGDIVIGSNDEDGNNLDVNLSTLTGYQHGVSRRHLILRPRRDKIFVMDLHSTNGTHVNGMPLSMGWAEELKDGDLLTLGLLHLRVRII